MNAHQRDSRESTKHDADNESLVLPALNVKQSRVDLVESFLAGSDEGHVAIRTKSDFLGMKLLIHGKYSSWVHIERQDYGSFDLTWTSGRDTHDRLKGHAYIIRIDQEGEVVSMFESAISMWMKYDHQLMRDPKQRERAVEIANHLFDRMRERGESQR